MAVYHKQMKDAKFDEAVLYLEGIWQRVLNLLGSDYSTNTTVLTGEVMDRDDVLKQAQESNKPLLVASVLQNELILLFHYCEYVEAADLAIAKVDEMCNDAPGVRVSITTYCYSALSCFSAYRTTRKRKYLKIAKTLSSKVKSWAHKGNPNLVHYVPLLDAEVAASRGRRAEAAKYYNSAITAVGRLGMPHEHAIVNERFGEFLLLLVGDRDEAKYRLETATELYREWGAMGKVEQMNSFYLPVWTLPLDISFRHAGGLAIDMSSLHLDTGAVFGKMSQVSGLDMDDDDEVEDENASVF